MPDHLYLPELSENHGIEVPDKFGHWHKVDRGVMLGISDGIIISNAEKARGISSIPDVWARPLMFQAAIKTTAQNPHPLRDRVLQEWRGLLSLLALAKIKNYPIEISFLDLGDEMFSDALKKLAPQSVKLEKDKTYKWTDIFFIRYDDIPIGAFSPTTLVYTATEYREALKNKDLVLVDEYGYLKPPDEDDEKLMVGVWLKNFQKKLKAILDRAEDNTDHRAVETILTLVDDWIKDIKNDLSIENDIFEHPYATISQELYDMMPKTTKEKLSQFPTYMQLLFPLDSSDASHQGFYSEISLDSDLGRNRSSYHEVVLITENLLGQNKRVWRNFRLKDFGGDAGMSIEKYFSEPSGHKIYKENISEKQAIWIRPDLYFLTNTLYKSKDGPFLVDAEHEFNVNIHYLLPFKKEILQFFSPKQIHDILQPEFKEEYDGVRFTFTLPLRNGGREKISKFYKTKELDQSQYVVKETNVPVLEIFPNYLDKNWRQYYLFHDSANIFQILPLVEDINADIVPRAQDIELEGDRLPICIFEINGDNAFPEAVEIKSRENNEILGLVLIQRPEEPREPEKSWKVGIDFGTSNTNVFKQSSTSEIAEIWQFALGDHVRQLTNCDQTTRQKLLESSFVPFFDYDLPIPTTLRVFSLAKKEHLFLDYAIHFANTYKSPKNIYADLKWDKEEESKVEYFLKSLLFLLFIDIVKSRVKEVELVCAYPKAFSDNSIAVFKGHWTSIIENMFTSNRPVMHVRQDNAQKDKIRISGPFYHVEGIAAGRYFASEKTITNREDRANIQIAAVCVDVGGGTTDVSIWHEGKIVADASILLAGRQVAQLFQKSAAIRELLFSTEAAMALEEVTNEPALFASRLNIILKNEEARIQETLLKKANNQYILWLRQMLTLEFAAISFYTAMLVVATDRFIAKQTNRGNALLSRIKEDELKLHWGGNAAKFINWINFGKYDKNGIASDMLNGAFYQCLKDVDIVSKKLVQMQSPTHKSEVSGGLVVMNSPSQDIRNPISTSPPGYEMVGSSLGGSGKYEIGKPNPEDASIGIISGEDITLEHRDANYLDPLSNKELFQNNRTTFKATDLTRLNRFIDVINIFGSRFGLFPESAKIQLSEQDKRLIKDGIKASYIDAQSLLESERSIEPIFIMEMRILLELLRDRMR